MERWIMHVDMDAFFASVEQRDHEAYRNQPVIVGGLSNRGVVSTASYEARRFGIHSAMPMVEARRRCPQGIFVAGNHGLYKAVSKQIFHIFQEFSPLVEPLSVDEAFLDITGMEKITLDRQNYAELLKKRIKDELGLIASVGIAPNKFLAKLASDLDKPDGLVIIERGREQSVLQDMPIRRLWGVGKKTGEKLQALGFKTIGQIAQASQTELAKYLGKTVSYQLIELANGRDDRKVEPERDIQSIGNEITFEQDLLQAAQVAKQFLALAEKVGWRLRLSGVKARTLTIKIRFASFQTITRSQSLLDPTNFDEVIYQMAVNLYQQVNVKASIRLLGITGSNLSLHEEESLFQDDQKKKALYHMMDDLKARFGENIITKANLIEPPSKESF